MLRRPAPAALRPLRPLAALLALPALSGCEMVVMNPTGDIARRQADLILYSTGLMLLIIIPVMVLTVVFAWRYRASNKDAEYDPKFDHSTGLELVIWSAPLLIVIALGALTWVSTHTLDPYRPLGRISATRTLPADQRPLEIQVVSMDWKWLFIYPEQGIATVNELVLPVDRQVRFRLTSSAVMNTFYVPTMAGMIYTMAGMETKLHAVLNQPGTFDGMSANYSGAGFSKMRFKTYGVDDARFEAWVAEQRRSPLRLDAATYLKLEQPTVREPVRRFSFVEQGLFSRAVNLCVKPGTPCMSESMRHGGGPNDRPGTHNPAALQRSIDEIDTSSRSKAGDERGDTPARTGSGQPVDRGLSGRDQQK